MARRPSKKGGRTMASNTYPNVHQMEATQLWQAWIKAWTPVECKGRKGRKDRGRHAGANSTKGLAARRKGFKLRGPYVGEHCTERLAARAQDRAVLKLSKSAGREIDVKLNFPKEDYVGDERLREVLTDEEFIELLRRESRAKYKRVEPTKCLKRFLEEEGRVKTEPEGEKARMPLADFLFELLMERKEDLTLPPAKRTAPWGRKRLRSAGRNRNALMLDPLLEAVAVLTRTELLDMY